jgi:S1-C subfamily serine protease
MHSTPRIASIVLAILGTASAACALGRPDLDGAPPVDADERAALYDSLAKEERTTPVVRIVQAVTPAVVFIQTEAYPQVRGFFGPEGRILSGAGAGGVINPKGYIVTD